MRRSIGKLGKAATVLAVGVLLVLAPLQAPQAASPERKAEARMTQVIEIDEATLTSLRDQGVAVVDVRRSDEWNATGVIEGATLLTAFDSFGRPVDGFVEKLQEVAGPETPVIMVCRSGNRSGAVANAMTKQLGYSKVYNLAHGMIGWVNGGHPAVRP